MRMCCFSILKTVAFQIVEGKEEVKSFYCTPAAHAKNGCLEKDGAFFS